MRSSALCLLVVGRFSGIWAETCDQLNPCLVWEVEPTSSTICAPCTWMACLRVEKDKTGCDRTTNRVGGICQKSDRTCNPTGLGEYHAEVDASREVCQSGAPGSTLQFAIEDGGACSDGGAIASSQISGYGASASCAPSTQDTCSGEGSEGQACVWTVKLPDVCWHGPTSGRQSTTPSTTQPRPWPTTNPWPYSRPHARPHPTQAPESMPGSLSDAMQGMLGRITNYRSATSNVQPRVTSGFAVALVVLALGLLSWGVVVIIARRRHRRCSSSVSDDERDMPADALMGMR